MALKENQPKRGHLRGTSENTVQKTGRGSGFGPGQPKIGTLHGTSTNAGANKATRPVPKETHKSRGTQTTPKGSGDGAPGTIGNHGSTEDSPDTIRSI